MKYEPLKNLAQIEDGDTVKTTSNGEVEVWRDVTVLHPNSKSEEILLDAHQNIYFITSMVLENQSWASEVMVMPSWDKGSDV